jgi:hypothetical protein
MVPHRLNHDAEKGKASSRSLPLFNVSLRTVSVAAPVKPYLSREHKVLDVTRIPHVIFRSETCSRSSGFLMTLLICFARSPLSLDYKPCLRILRVHFCRLIRNLICEVIESGLYSRIINKI